MINKADNSPSYMKKHKKGEFYKFFERRSVILYNLVIIIVMIFFIINKADNSPSQAKNIKKGEFYILFKHNF